MFAPLAPPLFIGFKKNLNNLEGFLKFWRYREIQHLADPRCYREQQMTEFSRDVTSTMFFVDLNGNSQSHCRSLNCLAKYEGRRARLNRVNIVKLWLTLLLILVVTKTLASRMVSFVPGKKMMKLLLVIIILFIAERVGECVCCEIFSMCYGTCNQKHETHKF